MPPRPITLAIVVFWLATSGYYLYQEFRFAFMTGTPPPYTIDLVDEARQLPIHWDVFQDGKRIGKAMTQIKQLERDNTFELHSRFDLDPKPNLTLGLSLAGLSSRGMYHVTRQGDLLAVTADVGIELPLMLGRVEGHVEGPVDNGVFVPTGWLRGPGFRQDLAFDPVPLSGRGSVLNPLHPVNRLVGLTPGQTWQIPTFDPFTVLSSAKLDGVPGVDKGMQAVGELLRGRQPTPFRSLHATVRGEPQMLEWETNEIPCWVIQYQESGGDRELSARTWVRTSDGLVLQQEASLRGTTLLLKRISLR